MIEVRPSPIHDRGVFATRPIRKGKIVLVDNVTVFTRVERDTILGTDTLVRYYWNWTADSYCLVLGLGSLMNCSYEPNIELIRYPRQRVMVFRACRHISTGEKLLIDYRKG